MNYITRLKKELSQKEREVASLRDGIRVLQSYLTSKKFAVDSTVQVSDVLLRLSEILSAANDVV